jgi:hypothetical protein
MDNPFLDGSRHAYLDNPFVLVRLPSNCVNPRLIAANVKRARGALGEGREADVSWAATILNDPNSRILYAIIGHPPPGATPATVIALAERLRSMKPAPPERVPLSASAAGLADLVPREPIDRLPRMPLSPRGRRFAPSLASSILRFALEHLR